MRMVPLVGVAMLLCTIGASSAMTQESDQQIDQPDQHTCDELADTYFRKPLQKRIDDFTSNTLAEQYNIYICGNQYREPPTLYLADPFASEGARAAAFLRERLAKARDDLTIRDIVIVFREMKRQHSYDVAGDEQLKQSRRESHRPVRKRIRLSVGSSAPSCVSSRPHGGDVPCTCAQAWVTTVR